MQVNLVYKIIEKSSRPLTALEILEKLPVNKTTVYRNLYKLLEAGKIKEVNIAPNITHYESTSLDHHHHLVCTNCGKIDEVNSESLENNIKRLISMLKDNFIIKEHNLEFFGLCTNCL